MAVEPADEADRRLGEKARQLVENIHAVVRGVQLLLMARGVDAAADLLVNGVHGVGRRSVKQGDRLLAAVGKFLLDDKARRDLVALVIILVRVEAVELGAQGDGLDQRCHDDVEEGVLELDALDVLFRKVGLDGLQIDALGDVGFVVGAVGVDDAHDKVQGVGLAQEHRVSAVAPASLRSLAHGVSSFLSDFLSAPSGSKPSKIACAPSRSAAFRSS